MVRYPHTAKLRTPNGTTQDSDGDFTDGESEVTLIGRYEPNSQRTNADYSGKFYTPIIQGFNPFEIDGIIIEIDGRTFKVVQMFNYQIHCEIWLD